MKKRTLNKIIRFRGSIPSSFNFLMSVYDSISFELQTNLKAISTPEQTFGNCIRSYRQKGLIQPVEKVGRELIISGHNLIQYLLIQRCLAIGATLKQLQVMIPNLTDKELHKLLLAPNLTLTDLPLPRTKPSSIPRSDDTLGSELPVWYNLKLVPGIQVSINANQYSIDDVKKIKKLFINAIENI